MVLPLKNTFNTRANGYCNFRNFFIPFLFMTIFYIVIVIVYNWKVDVNKTYEKVQLKGLRSLPQYTIKDDTLPSRPINRKCTYWDCFNLYRCGHTGHERITVYIYPLKNYISSDASLTTKVISQEFYKVLQALLNSKYYTSNPNEACLFVPSIDLLNQENVDLNFTNKVLQSLPFWYHGENHLIFNMISGTSPNFESVLELNLGNALIAGADFDSFTIRTGFDVPIPVYSPVSDTSKETNLKHKKTHRFYKLTSSQLNIDALYFQGLEQLQNEHQDLLLLDACYEHNYTKRCDVNSQKEYDYPRILQESQFCTLFRGERNGQFALLEMMAAGCIPVVLMDSPILPFSNVIDWKRAAVFIPEDFIHLTMETLGKISAEKARNMRKQVEFLYQKYFASIELIVETTLDIIQDRVFPQWGKTYDDWNLRPEESMKNPLFLPITAPKSQGFTAVILTYDRVESLFLLIEKLSKVPSLTKVVVVWNHQRKAPPSLSRFPEILQPISLIKTKANKLSNRFIPYEEIETEAILSIDDDIVMLTSDELEFGFEVWREFPDRIVGFPSRTHVWDNGTRTWRYESEWTNEISMVLTGAAFYHKYWNYLYTTAMPRDVKDWVDEHMNCEDIAMNFLIANVTNKPPIKVAPRKKFKCPECINNEMLSADLGHMVERSQCVDRFAKAFGRMPLKTVEFRADPVLYKDPFPEKLKRFNNIGSL